jgi:Rieske Fe-S protein
MQVNQANVTPMSVSDVSATVKASLDSTLSPKTKTVVDVAKKAGAQVSAASEEKALSDVKMVTGTYDGKPTTYALQLRDSKKGQVVLVGTSSSEIKPGHSSGSASLTTVHISKWDAYSAKYGIDHVQW